MAEILHPPVEGQVVSPIIYKVLAPSRWCRVLLQFAEDWTFLNIVADKDKSEKQVESRRVEYFDADGGHVS